MNVIRQCRTWIDQLVHNLSEADWASRHLEESRDSVDQTTSLSMALGMMGIVRRHTDESMTQSNS